MRTDQAWRDCGEADGLSRWLLAQLLRVQFSAPPPPIFARKLRVLNAEVAG